MNFRGSSAGCAGCCAILSDQIVVFVTGVRPGRARTSRCDSLGRHVCVATHRSRTSRNRSDTIPLAESSASSSFYPNRGSWQIAPEFKTQLRVVLSMRLGECQWRQAWHLARCLTGLGECQQMSSLMTPPWLDCFNMGQSIHNDVLVSQS